MAGPETGSSVPLAGGAITYTVKPGDYANRIAGKAGGGCSGTELLDFNPEVKTLIPGGTLRIPPACLATGVTEESLNAEAEPTDSGTDSNSDSTDSQTDTTDKPAFNTYVVVSGDYAFKIVKKVGCTFAQLKKANPGKMSRLKPKMKLKVPVSCDTREADSTDSTDSSG